MFAIHNLPGFCRVWKFQKLFATHKVNRSSVWLGADVAVGEGARATGEEISVLLSSSSARAGARALQPPDNPSIEVAAT